MKEKYAIHVIENIYEARELKICRIIDIEYEPKITKKSYYIGFGDIKGPKFLNWYENFNYIKTWESKKEAELFLEDLIEKAKNNYKTKKDPFRHLYKTKGNWKYLGFIVTKLS